MNVCINQKYLILSYNILNYIFFDVPTEKCVSVILFIIILLDLHVLFYIYKSLLSMIIQ